MPSLPALVTLLLCYGYASGATLNEHFDGSLPSGWLAQDQQWLVVPDPDPAQAQNKVLHVEALDDHVATLSIARDALGDGTLRFRSRFATPYPSVVDANKNDGKHFPHWRMNFMPQVEGAGLVFIDNHVWATLELVQDNQTVVKQDGVRKQDAWIEWAITCTDGTCTVLQDGHQVLTATYAKQANSGLSMNVMHGQLWLDDISFKP